MINFIVVEDIEEQRKNVEKLIINYMMKNKLSFDIKLFETENDELLKLINNKEKHHIYILDLQLPNTNAINIARKIRKHDWDSPIIIYTVNGSMALETFKQRLQILDFVNKQYMCEENLGELFDICLEQFNLKNYLKFNYKNTSYNIDTNKIIYIYRDTIERKCVIVTDHKNYKINLSLNELKEKLTNNFEYSHKSCLVNKDHIECIDWGNLEIYFDNNMKTNLVTKTHKKELEF